MKLICRLLRTTDINAPTWGFNLFAKGFAEYRLGHYATAVDLLQQVIPMDVGAHCRTEARLVLAMAQFQLGQQTESRTSLAKAADAVTRELPKAAHLTEEWGDWISIHILMREAEALIEGESVMRTEITLHQTPCQPDDLEHAPLNR